MTPSSQCKAAGLESLAELTRLSGVAKSTLIDWHRQDQNKFNLAISGALYRKQIANDTGINSQLKVNRY